MSHLTIKKVCLECNIEFTAKSNKGTYCSKKCFKRNYRKLLKKNSIVIPKVKPILTKESIKSKHYLSVKEAVISFEISEVTLRRLIKLNKLNYVCIKNRFIFLKRDIQNILSHHS